MRIVIAEDSGLIRQMLAEVLAGRGLDVIGQVRTPPELLPVVAADPPDVVTMDIRMPPTHRDEGLRAAEEIHARHPSVGLLVLSHYVETAYAVRLLQLSSRAVGYLIKDRIQDADHLVHALQRVAAGEVVVDPDVIRRVLHRPRVDDPVDRLIAVEREVLALMAKGRSNTAIAQKLNYSVKTVEKRITSISQKLGLPHPDDHDRSDVNIRVLAVLAYLRRSGASDPDFAG